MQRTAIALVFFILFVGGAVLLQIYLSKSASKWPGLILPVICIFCSLLAVLSLATFTFNTYEMSNQVTDEYGMVVSSVVVKNSSEMGQVATTITMAVMVFVMYNIPTLVLLAIYFTCRRKIKRNKEIEKMNIQDLE